VALVGDEEAAVRHQEVAVIVVVEKGGEAWRQKEGQGGAARPEARKVPSVAVFRGGPVGASAGLSGADLVEGGGQNMGTVLSKGRRGNGRIPLLWF